MDLPAARDPGNLQPPGPATRTLGWRDRWLAWRDRLLASPSFQRKAAAFPFTRPMARRRARELFDIVAGFVYSQVLLACVRLKLFDLLATGPLDAAEIAVRTGLPLEGTERLLGAAVSLRLLERRSGGAYGLGVLGAPMVGNEGLALMIEHHTALYADLRDPVALLRGEAADGALASYWPYAEARAPRDLPSQKVRAYSALMTASQPLVADEVLDAYPVTRHRCLMDVGGGEGRFLASAATRAPRLQLVLFDLPPVAEAARARFAELGLQSRARAVGGDFFVGPLPRGADLISLVRVVHDHGDEEVRVLLRNVYEALPAGGTLLLAEPMADTPGAQPMGEAYFGLYLLAMGRGRPRTVRELTAMLNEAGFGDVRLSETRIPLQTCLLVARKPGASQWFGAP